MKGLLITACFVTLAIALPAAAQAPMTDSQEFLSLMKEVQTQQEQILSNQTKIETRISDIAEVLRVSRIYSERSQ